MITDLHFRNVDESKMILVMTLCFTLLTLIVADNLYAQTNYEKETRLMAYDYAAGDWYGYSVSISGNLAIIGAPDNDDTFNESGSAYIARFDDSGWIQEAKLTMDYIGADHRFGEAVAISGTYAIVGAPSYFDNYGINSSIHFYHYENGNWIEKQRISPETTEDGFGRAVDIDGDRAVVTAPWDSDSGAVYIYRFDGNNWMEEQKLIANDAASGAYFGGSVSINGNTVIVGDPYNDGNGSNAGAAYIFVFDGSNWIQSQKLMASDGAADDYFGNSVAVDNNFAVIGANEDDDNDTASGSAYVFQLADTGWVQQEKLLADEGDQYDRFGTSVAINENMLVVGAYGEDGGGEDAPEVGATYLYIFNGTSWDEYLINPGGGPDQNCGRSVDIDKGAIISGAPIYSSSRGAAYIHELVATPGPVTASNGLYNNRNKISWENNSNRVESFKIYRDFELIDSTAGGARAYYDYNGIPGKIHSYGVSASDAYWGESLIATSLGWQPANGKLGGTVKTPYGGVVDSVAIEINSTNEPIGSCMEFNGNDDYVIINPFNDFTDDAITVSFWIMTEDQGDTYPFSFFRIDYPNPFLIANPSNISISIATDGFNNEETGPTGISVNDGNWHHIAVTWQSLDGEINLLKDGKLVFSGLIQQGNFISGFGSLVFGQNYVGYGGYVDTTHAFSGRLDEIRIWDQVRDPDDIQADMYRRLKGDEQRLVSYWTFDDLSDRTPQGIAGDYAKDSGNHGRINGAVYSDETGPVQGKILTDIYGSFKIENIYYNEETEFEVTPSKTGHNFDPPIQRIVMNTNAPQQMSVDFIDTTALTVTGIIKFSGTNCSVPNVEILLDDKETGVYTDAAGAFQLTIDKPNIYNIKPVLGESVFAHKFDPAAMNVNVDENVLGLRFNDTTYHRLSGKFGAPCDADIGSAEIIIKNLGDNAGCFEMTIWTDASGNYSVLLPAQAYEVDLKNVNITDPNLYNDIVLQYFTPDTVDLTWIDKEHDFTYHNEPIIRISEWPKFGEGDYNVPIMDQGKFYDLIIEIFDVWGVDTCLVNQGTVTIYDDISGIADKPISVDLDGGRVFYRCVPGEPNLQTGGGRSYQKSFFVVARTGEHVTDFTQWAVITGAKRRGSEFYTIATPKMPLWVLNDPPGDKSFSFFKKDSAYSTTIRNTYDYKVGDGFFADLQIGAVASVGVGFVVSVSTDDGAYALTDFSFFWGKDTAHTYTKVITFTTSKEFKSSDMDNIVGEEGDVYIGASFNDEFALADILGFDWNTYEVTKDTALVYLQTNFDTDFIYTESHIVKTLIPQLKELARLNPDEATNYNAQIKIWQQKIEENHRLKEKDNPDTKLHKNWSFDAGPSLTETYTTHPTDTTWAGYTKSTYDFEGRFGVGIVKFGCTYEFGYNGKVQSIIGDEHETSVKTTETYGYTLADDDPGDNFTVDVKYKYNTLANGTEEIFGPPIFTLVSGQTSNPWEKGSQARDGVSLALEKYEIYNVPPNDPAPFILFLGNTSESGEEREYHLSVIQQSNLDGAIIRVGGVVIEDHLSYTIPAGQQLNATMSVERGPIAYDYENLKVKFYAPGDEGTIADTVTFSVHYISPCSNVNLLLPENNWLVNASHNDTLQFVINDYDVNNQHLKTINLQYRRLGESWKTPFTYLKKDLPKDFVMEYWNVNDLPDGDYELRAVSDCGQQGVKYSAVAEGVIDRRALIVFGTPEPADGVLNLGEEISISFNGEIDPAFFSAAENVSLMTADDSTIIKIDAAAFENTVKITESPDDSLNQYEDRLLIATVNNIRDIHGNTLRKAVSWTFRVNQSPVYWTVPNVDYTVYQGAEESFMRRLKNAGGIDDSFTIISYPQWLTPNILNGTIPSSGEREITFTVNTQLNVAAYRDTVVVITSYGEERLLVTLTVLHEPPAWQVNPALYSYNMNITAQVVFDDTLSRDVYDIIGVYSGNEIRGVTRIEHVAILDKYVAFITVYSNQAAAETLTFRMWDASAGKGYAFFGSDYSFTSNSSLGTVSTPLIIKPDASVQVIDLYQGWTWFSLNVDAGPLPLDVTLSSLSPSEGDVIKGQNAFSQYSKDYGWQGGLQALTIASSYQIFLKNGGSLQYTGKPVDPLQATINIREGWNWIAHLNQKIQELNETLDHFPAILGDRIKSQTEFADFVAATQTWEGSLKNMIPGQGYLLKSGQDVNFLYPVLGKPAFLYPAIPEWEIDINAFEYTMSITTVVEFDAKEMEDSTLIVGAFSGYECRGLTQIQYVPGLNKYLGFLPVYSNSASGDSVNFEVFEPVSGKKRQITERISFVSDKLVGDLNAPFVLTAQPIGDELVPLQYYLRNNYPNPFNPETIIEYGLSIDGDVELSVFNILGQKVATLVDERQEAHHYKITFNAADHMLATGVYFYQLKSGNFIQSRKLLYLK